MLWGHHFTAVAGRGADHRPGIAVIWGWLPAFLWVVLGTVFFAGVHDFGAIWASVRNKGKSIGALTGDVVGPAGAHLFMIVIFLLLLMVNAVFAVTISRELVEMPSCRHPGLERRGGRARHRRAHLQDGRAHPLADGGRHDRSSTS